MGPEKYYLCLHSGFLLSQHSSSFSYRNGFWPESHVGNEMAVNVHVEGVTITSS